MTAQDAASSLWACASMGVQLGSVQEPLGDAVLAASESMHAQDVARTLLSFAALQMPGQAAREPLLTALLRVAEQVTPEEWRLADEGVQYLLRGVENDELMLDVAAALENAKALQQTVD